MSIALILKYRVGCRSCQEMKVNFIGTLSPNHSYRVSVIDRVIRNGADVPLIYIKDFNSKLLARQYKFLTFAMNTLMEGSCSAIMHLT